MLFEEHADEEILFIVILSSQLQIFFSYMVISRTRCLEGFNPATYKYYYHSTSKDGHLFLNSMPNEECIMQHYVGNHCILSILVVFLAKYRNGLLYQINWGFFIIFHMIIYHQHLPMRLLPNKGDYWAAGMIFRSCVILLGINTQGTVQFRPSLLNPHLPQWGSIRGQWEFLWTLQKSQNTLFWHWITWTIYS